MRDLLSRFLPCSLQDGWQRATFLALAGSVSSGLVSIAASQILLFGAVVGAIRLYRRGGDVRPASRSVLWPLGLFFLWTILAALASSDIWLGLTIIKKFYIFLLIILVPIIVKGTGRTLWIYRAVFAVVSLASLLGVAQFITDPGRDLLHRISGSMSHWMTYSGLLMLVFVALGAYAVCWGWGRMGWVVPLGLLITAALLLSYTRNAWLGSIAGLFLLLLLRRPRALLGLLGILVAIYFLSPESVRQRFQTGLDLSDPDTRNRIELFQTSWRLIKDNPWFGVGPKNVNTEALRYRGTDEYPDWMYQHMHNNFLQIASERGIPGMLLWMWLMGHITWNAFRVFRRAREQIAEDVCGPAREAMLASTAALASMLALLVAGMFEYNFGDSEVLALFLFIVSAPYAFAD